MYELLMTAAQAAQALPVEAIPALPEAAAAAAGAEPITLLDAILRATRRKHRARLVSHARELLLAIADQLRRIAADQIDQLLRPPVGEGLPGVGCGCHRLLSSKGE